MRTMARLKAAGHSNREIARRLGVSEKAIRKLLARVDRALAERALRDPLGPGPVGEVEALAHRTRARAVVVLAQAQPGFDVPETAANERRSSDYDGFTDFLTELVAQARAFPGQILYAYGDDHTFRVHQPFSDPIDATWFEGRLVPNLTALQTYGNPYPYWVKVHVDTDSPGVFSFEPRIPR
jgi:DNA-binding Lrp family transcriptional regulator